jgi:hypothetical protein
MRIKERAILKRIRKCSLWAFLVSSAVVLIITILETWNALETHEVSFFGSGEPTAWGRIENTASIVMGISLLLLLTILIADRAKSGDGHGKKVKAPEVVAKPAASTATVIKSTAKAATSKTKKPASKKK